MYELQKHHSFILCVIFSQKRDILKACSPFAIKYFLKLHSGKWQSLTNRVDQYRSLIYSLIGKRGNLSRPDFETIEKLLQSLMSEPQKRKLKPIEKSFHKWNRQKHLDDSLPIFPYCLFVFRFHFLKFSSQTKFIKSSNTQSNKKSRDQSQTHS